MPAFSAPYIAGTDANRTVKDALAEVLTRRSGRKRISVTDLITPRQAFFARIHPEIQPSPERQQTMMAGTGFHEAFGRAVSTEEFVEQLVEFQEIVGKIDIYEESPVEVKTTGAIPTDPIGWRPYNVEQLGMYCTMVERPRGHLIYFRRSEWGRPSDLKAYALEFTDLPGIAAEMVRRRDLLRSALETHDPGGLPRCEWFGRQCDYSEICGCALAPPLERLIGYGTVRVQEAVELTRRLVDGIGGATFPKDRVALNDLVFPRKAAFRRMPGGGESEETAQERMASFQRRAFDEALKDAIWYGFPGRCRYVRASLGSVGASVMLFHDVPTILRTYRRREMVDRRRLAEDVPFYVDRLAFECALTENSRGRLVVYYSEVPDDKFMVYDFWFRDLPQIRAEMQRRLDLLESGAEPSDLPACQPTWMMNRCQFAPGCRCSEG